MVSRHIAATEIEGSRALRTGVGGGGACGLGVLVLLTGGSDITSHQAWAFIGWTVGAAVTELVASTSRRPRPDDILTILGVLLFSGLLLLVLETAFLSWVLLIVGVAILARIVTWIIGCPRWQSDRRGDAGDVGSSQFSVQALATITFLVALVLVIGPKIGFHRHNVIRATFLFAPVAVLWFAGMVAAVWGGRRRAWLTIFTGVHVLAICYAIGFSDRALEAAGVWFRSYWGQSIVGPLASAVAAGLMHYLSRVDRAATRDSTLRAGAG